MPKGGLVEDPRRAANPYDAGREQHRRRKGNAEKALARWRIPKGPHPQPTPDLPPEPEKMPDAVHAGPEPTRHLTEADQVALEGWAWKLLRAPRVDSGLEQTFRELAEEWYKDTRTAPSVSRMVMHPAYLRIIWMGRKAIPLLLRELERTRDHWLVALYAVTGEDPAPKEANFDEAVDAWLAWGRREGHI